MTRRVFSSVAGALAALALCALTSCTDQAVTTDPGGILAGKGGGGGSGGLSVSRTDPTSALQDTTLDVRVLGSGFDNGSRAEFALNGVVGPKVRTNSTGFVSSSELVANITIAADAVPDLYDVQVTTSNGKKGIGTEMFTVTLRTVNLGASGGLYSRAHAVNANGEIVGAADLGCCSGGAAYWSRNTQGVWVMRALQAPSQATGSDAFDINDAGQIVGRAVLQGRHAMLWQSVDAPPEDLGTLPGKTDAEARAINNSGQIVGWSGNAFLWQAGTMYDLGTLGGAGSWAEGINNSGVIVGWSSNAAAEQRAFVWTPDPAIPGLGVMVELPPLPGYTWVQARGINDPGVVVGTAGNGSSLRAVRWTTDALGAWRIEDLGALKSRDDHVMANAVSGLGDIVGYSGGRNETAFLRRADGTWRELRPPPGGGRSVAYGLNDARVVVGEAGSSNGTTAVLWIVP